MVGHVKDKARDIAVRSAWGLAGGILVCIGLGFLTSALWLVLSTLRDPLFASTVIGIAFTGVGLIAMGIASRSPRKHPMPPQADPVQETLNGFLRGLDAGISRRHS